MDRKSLSSLDEFRQVYAHGLTRVLEGEKLGGLILACANIKFAPKVLAEFSPDLEAPFERFDRQYQKLLSQGMPLPDSDDDLLVFLKILCMGLEQLGTTEHRVVGEWEVQFNHIRSFRPRRTAQNPVEGIRKPFNKNGFHFNKPFLRIERFWQGKEAGIELDLFYNKFPFADFHALLVPDPAKEMEQFLSEEYHKFIWKFTQELSTQLPGIGFGYNSYGAFASVNHLHFQMFIRDKVLPVVNNIWQHNAGPRDYPSTCKRFDSPDESWNYIEMLHRKKIAYNLLYIPGRVYCFPRRNQGTYKQHQWTSGFAWYEMSGSMITFNREDYEALEENMIVKEFSGLILPNV